MNLKSKTQLNNSEKSYDRVPNTAGISCIVDNNIPINTGEDVAGQPPALSDGQRTLKILQEGERFALESRYYSNIDETIILRSTDATGKLFKRTEA